ncbi:hypothetical protein D3C81_1921420 [compost metagenome]
MLFKRQGDVEAQAVIATGPFMRCSHDAATCACDDHQVGACQGGAQLTGEGVHRVFQWRSGRAEHRHLATALVALQGAERVVQLAQGLQGDLGAPAVRVVVGHAQDG